MKIHKTGMAWYQPNDYERLKQIFSDGDKLPATYEQWLQKAENGIAQLRRDGHVIVKVNLNPDTFIEWCRVRGLDVNSDSRRRFASEFVARIDYN